MQVPPLRTYFGAITADISSYLQAAPLQTGAEAGFPRVAQPAPALCQEQALAPAALRQRNKAGKTHPKPHGYSCPHTAPARATQKS